MLRKIIKGLNRKSSRSSGMLALYISKSDFRLVDLETATITHFRSESYDADSLKQALHTLLSSVTKHRKLHIVLSPDFYQLVQIDKPALSETEMLQALPWQVKDLVDISPDDIIADYIDLPSYNSQTSKINVVVASTSWLKQLVQYVTSSELHIHSIQPEEWLAMGLIAPTGQATMLVIHQPENELLIQIVRDGQLYFSRRARGFGQLHLSTEAELRDDSLDRLQLELQRSMDYFESQLKQPPVRDIRLLMAQSALITDLLRQNGFGRVEPLANLPLAQALSTEQLISCWPGVAVLNQSDSESVA
ncbi:hypothetical protein ORJ00_07540 [Rheinheimera baltica]|uniref:hypothetical protein n=1 Tax=Rheinheimera baltica TaxID=67576 RepID=UPI00273EC1F6|nr:hypothetical protein [Rheinheimera baltica]MDP5142590.1 hypothetical protein [Rheinheimera baltica]MDP5151899.1 hypothetical protein [Rheinheimera baltica]